MKLIVGLGNPGRKYEKTRHNVGFRVIDELARRWQIELTPRRSRGKLGSGRVKDQRVVLLKPTTYMNRSGRAVREELSFRKLQPQDLLVVLDDMALPLGRLRIRARGSAGGHNGLSNVIDELGSEAFARLRMGIEWIEGRHAVRYVLSAFAPEEEQQIAQTILRAADAVECWLAKGVEVAMNTYNRPEQSPGG